MVVGFQQVEAGGHARIEGAELGEIGAVLNLVVGVEMLQELVDRRHEGALEGGGISGAVAKGVGHLLQLTAMGAQGSVHMQPEVGQLAVVGVGLPLRLRIGGAQVSHLVGQAEPIGQMQFRRNRHARVRITGPLRVATRVCSYCTVASRPGG